MPEKSYSNPGFDNFNNFAVPSIPGQPRFPGNVKVIDPTHLPFVNGKSNKIKGGLRGIFPLILTGGFVILFLAIALLSGALAFNPVFENIKLDQLVKTGVKGNAVVVRQEINNPSSGKKSYYLAYEYQVPEQSNPKPKTYQGQTEVDQNFYQGHIPGTNLDILYLPNQPGTSDILGKAKQEINWIFVVAGGILAILFLASAFLIILGMVRARKKIRQLELKGRPLLGSVTNVKIEQARTNKSKQLVVNYTFQNPQGREMYGVSRPYFESYHRNINLAPGDLIGLVYLNDKVVEVM